MTKVIKLHCAICGEPCIFVDDDYCIKEFVAVCTPCFKKINPRRTKA